VPVVRLLQWDKVSSRFTAIYEDDTSACSTDVVRLARDFAIPSILPTALYHYAISTTFDGIFHGLRREDDTVSILSVEDQQLSIKGWRRAATSKEVIDFGT
jgi:hypothetical protein